MFLFEGYFGRILYTGDFRYRPSILNSSALSSKPIDYLYFDNTFSHPQYSFPTQSQVKDKILKIIQQHPNHDVAIGIDNLGKEELLLFLALELDTKVY